MLDVHAADCEEIEPVAKMVGNLVIFNADLLRRFPKRKAIEKGRLDIAVEYLRNNQLAIAGIGDHRTGKSQRSKQVANMKLGPAHSRERGRMQNEQDRLRSSPRGVVEVGAAQSACI